MYQRKLVYFHWWNTQESNNSEILTLRLNQIQNTHKARAELAEGVFRQRGKYIGSVVFELCAADPQFTLFYVSANTHCCRATLCVECRASISSPLHPGLVCFETPCRATCCLHSADSFQGALVYHTAHVTRDCAHTGLVISFSGEFVH